jgi:hypothetical protein
MKTVPHAKRHSKSSRAWASIIEKYKAVRQNLRACCWAMEMASRGCGCRTTMPAAAPPGAPSCLVTYLTWSVHRNQLCYTNGRVPMPQNLFFPIRPDIIYSRFLDLYHRLIFFRSVVSLTTRKGYRSEVRNKNRFWKTTDRSLKNPAVLPRGKGN